MEDKFKGALEEISVRMDTGLAASANAIIRPDGSIALIDLSLAETGPSEQTSLIESATKEKNGIQKIKTPPPQPLKTWHALTKVAYQLP